MEFYSTQNCQHQSLSVQLTDKGITLLPSHKQHKYCLIFLHGFGMPVSKFLNVFLSPEMLNLLSDFKVYIPQAPKRAHGKQSQDDSVPRYYSWYDMEDRSTLEETVKNVQKMIIQESKLLDNMTSRVFLGGFSQGSFVTLYASHVLREKIGGAIIISAFKSKIIDELPEKDELPPTLVIHGGKDNVKKIDEAEIDLKHFFERPNVRKIVIEDMNHDLNHRHSRTIISEFLREKTTNAVTARPRL